MGGQTLLENNFIKIRKT